MRLHIVHQTEYNYEAPVDAALEQLRVTPVSASTQIVSSWECTIDNGKVEVQYTDHNENLLTLVSLEPGAVSLTIRCEGYIDTIDTNGVLGDHTGFIPLWFFLRSTELTEPGKCIDSLIGELDTDLVGIQKLHALSNLIGEKVRYETGTTTTKTTAEEAFELGCGVCQDHTHIFLGGARKLGFPARYVSGYLAMDDCVDQGAGHAWAEAYIEHLGWVGFDVSNGISPDERYVRVSTGLDAFEAAPITGAISGGANENLAVSVQVQQQ